MKNNDWKNKLGSLLPEGYTPEPENRIPAEKNPTTNQTLRVELDKRNGKPATLISEFEGSEDELKELGKLLKTKCGVGGAAKESEIIIQGDFKLKVMEILKKEGFSQTKAIG